MRGKDTLCTEDREEIMQLIQDSQTVILGSVDSQGYPNTKGMQQVAHEGLKTFYFSTFTDAARTKQYQVNSKACLYFFRNTGKVAGLMLMGGMAVLTDSAVKEKFWVDGWTEYYPLGVTDPNYCILKFTAVNGKYSSGPKNLLFDVKESADRP